MKKFASHTLVKNGMPFLDLVLRQVIPYANRSLITVSKKADEGTLKILRQLKKEHPDKVKIWWENVQSPGELTHERQKQVKRTTEDWILFLDDDDYWPTESLEEMVERINKDEDIDGYSVNPYQLVDEKHYDWNWRSKYFLKWFKNQSGIRYRHPYPRDLIYRYNTLLYWKKNPRVPKIETKFFHLSYLKWGSWREAWGKKDYAHKIGELVPLPGKEEKNIKKVYEQINRFSRR